MPYVRVWSWLEGHYYSHTLHFLKDLLRTCEGSDMQTARLAGEARSYPWNQVFKHGLSDTLTRCGTILSNEVVKPTSPVVDEYPSDFLAQLDVIEAVVTCPVRSGNRGFCISKGGRPSKKLGVKVPCLQSEVDLSLFQTISMQASAGISGVVPIPSRSARGNKSGSRVKKSNKRTGGKPGFTKANVSGSEDDP